ncbi:MAG TPA: hypothetical protein VFB79_05550 [Candidatus Angelobacter sp.]|nr:hypothetical protein [Candidatus Angelobacter sp.]
MASGTFKTISGVILGDLIFAAGSVLMFFLAKVDPHAPAPLSFILLSTAIGIALAFAGGFVGGMVGGRADLICGIFAAQT